MRATLADGSEVLLDVYTVSVEWDSQLINVSALEADGGPLIGMSLLYGCSLHIDVIDGGVATITTLH